MNSYYKFRYKFMIMKNTVKKYARIQKYEFIYEPCH